MTNSSTFGAPCNQECRGPLSISIYSEHSMFPSRSAEDEATAYHEAGHAVMAALRDLPPLSGSIVPAGNRVAGRTEFPDVPPAFKNYLGTSAEKRAYIETRVPVSYTHL